jgi:hypothetical protein
MEMLEQAGHHKVRGELPVVLHMVASVGVEKKAVADTWLVRHTDLALHTGEDMIAADNPEVHNHLVDKVAAGSLAVAHIGVFRHQVHQRQRIVHVHQHKDDSVPSQ